MTLLLSSSGAPGLALLSPAATPTAVEQQAQQASDLEQQGQLLYNSGRFSEAVSVFQQAARRYQQTGDRLGQATVLSNLALTESHLGNWTAANQAIAQSLELLNTALAEKNTQALPILAQTLNVQGFLQLEQGQSEAALETWKQATSFYTQLKDANGVLSSQINQASALQALGFYRRAIELLTPLREQLSLQPDSNLKATGLRSLGDALQVAGDLSLAQEVLQESLTVAEHLQQSDTISAAQLSLGAVAQSQKKPTEALAWYQRAIATANSPLSRLQASLPALQIAIEQQRWQIAQPLWQQAHLLVNQISPGRTQIFAQVNLAHQGMEWSDQTAPPRSAILSLLTTAMQQAQGLGDRQAESYALGTLGKLYEQNHQWSDAQHLTEQALLLAQGGNTAHITYQWQWQLGRILNAQRQVNKVAARELRQQAIAAYTGAVKTLQSIRSDLVAINPNVQFSFQESIEPIHRQLVSLLLSPEPDESSNPIELEQARQLIESLQQAELENFFREACLNAQPVAVDQVDPQAAIIYPIILPDRLEVIVHLPQRPLQHHTIPVSQAQVEATVQQLRSQITFRFQPAPTQHSQQLYDWLIRPIADELTSSQVMTLVFVLDGSLRSIPMSVLYDGRQFLLERYRIALTPGLQLLASRPLQQTPIRVLAAGLSAARQGFASLPGVEQELEEIQTIVPTTRLLLNQEFTTAAVQQNVSTIKSSIVHLATHGQFSSDFINTFLLTWDNRLTINQMKSLLQNTDLNRREPIELLVLSACTTATGDRQATLGLAGMAVQAGARSTIASLWSVDDQATSELMIRFYRELFQAKTTKAEALRQAQLSILDDPRYRKNPYFWAAFVLIGNWL